jgi:hypothetical protein
MWRYLLKILMILCLMGQAQAWNIGAAGRTVGPSIHTTYFLTPKNAPLKVHAQAYVGLLVNGICNYNANYDLGTQTLQSGDMVGIDAFALKALIGGNYSCMSIFYTYQQIVMETFQLIYDGTIYTITNPLSSQVNVI